MKSIANQLHMILGSMSAMLVAFLSLLNGTSPSTCMMKAMAAFLVFAGFGLILRHILLESLDEATAKTGGSLNYFDSGGVGSNLDMIVPGTSVADLLGSQEEIEIPGESDDQAEAA